MKSPGSSVNEHFNSFTMNRREFLLTNLLAGATVLMSRGTGSAQSAKDIETRVDKLLKQLSLEEKVQFLRGDGDFSSQGNKRLNLPGISMADSPQGVRIEGNSTVFPSPVAMAASWNVELIEKAGAVLGRELRAKGRDMLLGPCVNIHRSPLGGRNTESFGEDPYLSGKIAVAYIKGVQSEKVAACVKHFAANNLETRRLFLDVTTDLRYLHEIEFPPFKMAVEEVRAFGVMASYNRVNGHYSWANRYLLTDVLRNQWNYKGVITSDWGCEWMLPEERSVLESIDAGTNIHMPMGWYYGEPLIKAVKDGKVKEAAVDRLVRQNLIVIHELGLVGEKKNVDQSPSDTKAHHALAYQVAAESIVLLKNDGPILPLNRHKLKTLAVIGPNAAVAQLGDRGSAFAPTSYTVSPLKGLQSKLGSSVVVKYVKGYEIKDFATIPPEALTTPDGRPGLLAEFFVNKDFEGKPVLTKIDGKVKFNWGTTPPKEVVGAKKFVVRWTGQISSAKNGPLFLGLKSNGVSKLYIDDRLLIENTGTFVSAVDPNMVKYARIDLPAGVKHHVRVEYEKGDKESAVELLWTKVPETSSPFREAVEIAKDADAVIVFAGLNIDYEGEGLDRFDMNLPELQNELINAVVEVNPQTVVVINSGTPNDLTKWIDKVPAVLQAWYPGMEGGNAVADILFGDINPSGKLPVTFARRREDYADFPHSTVIDDQITYAESIFVGYRHFEAQKIAPLFPFGHGLSYTKFSYDNLKVRSNNKKRSVEVRITISNVGQLAGREIIQLYVRDIESSIRRPLKELKAFQKITLLPNEKKQITFRLNEDAFSYYDPQNRKWVFEAGMFELQIGSSAGDIRSRKVIEFKS